MPRVPVVLSGCEQEALVDEAVESILQQTFEPRTDRARQRSGDRTPAVPEQYGTDLRVRPFLHGDNASITRQFNEGVRASIGELVCFPHPDSHCLRHKPAVLVRAFGGAGPEIGVVNGLASGRNKLTGDRWGKLWIEADHRHLWPIRDFEILWPHAGRLVPVDPGRRLPHYALTGDIEGSNYVFRPRGR